MAGLVFRLETATAPLVTSIRTTALVHPSAKMNAKTAFVQLPTYASVIQATEWIIDLKNVLRILIRAEGTKAYPIEIPQRYSQVHKAHSDRLARVLIIPINSMKIL